MALLNSKKYEKLNDYGAGTQASRPQTFRKIFISGEPREGQKVGHMHCLHDFDKNEYIIQNAESINFIPMFIKQVREGYDNPQAKNRKLIYFSLNPREDTDYPETAKCNYIFAGAALDSNMKPYPRKDDPTKTALVHFKCDGIKMGGAIDYLKAISEATSKLPPISDDPEFEKATVSWRRFIVNVTVGTAKSDYGNKYVFVFTPSKQLPDEKVVSFMDQSETLTKQFLEQFDLSSYVVGKRSVKQNNQQTNQTSQGSNKEQKTEPTQEQAQVKNELENIDLGI
jgi:hypothetical protein